MGYFKSLFIRWFFDNLNWNDSGDRALAESAAAAVAHLQHQICELQEYLVDQLDLRTKDGCEKAIKFRHRYREDTPIYLPYFYEVVRKVRKPVGKRTEPTSRTRDWDCPTLMLTAYCFTVRKVDRDLFPELGSRSYIYFHDGKYIEHYGYGADEDRRGRDVREMTAAQYNKLRKHGEVNEDQICSVRPR